ncbi:MAG: hypothetical protein ACPIOQ_45285, partial [Promethearchaeia archaeon]
YVEEKIRPGRNMNSRPAQIEQMQYARSAPAVQRDRFELDVLEHFRDSVPLPSVPSRPPQTII